MSAQMTDQSGDENSEQETDDTAKKPEAGSDLRSLTTKKDAYNNGASDSAPTLPENEQQDSIHQSVTFKEHEKCTDRDVTVVEFPEKDQDSVNSISLSHNTTLDIIQVTAYDLEEARSTPAEERPLVSPILQHISDRAPVAGTGAEKQDQRSVEDKDELILLLKYKMPPGEKLVRKTEKFSCSKDFLKYWNFFTRTNKGKKMLEVIVEKDKCSVKVSNDDDGLFIFEVSDKKFEQESDVKGFADRVLRSVNECAQKSLSLGCFKVDFAMQDDILQQAKSLRELDSAWIEVDVEHDPETIFGVCTVEDKESVFGLIAGVIAQAKKSFENHVEKVTVDVIWQTVLKSLGYLKEMDVNFPRTKIKPDGTIFQLEGPKKETKFAAAHVKELVQKARKEVIQEHFSPGFQFEIFLHQEMQDYITESIQNFPVAWIPDSKKKKIHVFSRKHESLKGVDKCIQGCIREKQYSWPKLQCIQSHKIKLLENLREKHKGKIVIQSSDTGLLVTTSDALFANVDSEVQNIIRMGQTSIDQSVSEEPDNRYEQPVRRVEPIVTSMYLETNDEQMENDNTKSKQITKTVEVKEKRLFKLLLEELPNVVEMAKTRGVCICGVEKTNKVGFELKGLDKPVQDMFEYLTQKVKMEEKKMKDCGDLTGATKNVRAERELTNADVQSKSNRMYGPSQQGMQVPPRMPGQNQMQGPSQQGMQVPPRMPGQNQMQESYIKRIRVKVEKGFLHEAQNEFEMDHPGIKLNNILSLFLS